ncbi:MAG TPA: hypothetical protein VH877_21960 [Polyangia bacterium]|nr:hypothetical protein [Polyangia bacterium]
MRRPPSTELQGERRFIGRAHRGPILSALADRASAAVRWTARRGETARRRP